MLDINFEFRKGIFFIRLIGNLDNNYLNKENKIKELIEYNRFKYIVINTNYIDIINLNGINHLIDIFQLIQTNDAQLILCDKSNFFKRLLKGKIPSIKDELEVL